MQQAGIGCRAFSGQRHPSPSLPLRDQPRSLRYSLSAETLFLRRTSTITSAPRAPLSSLEMASTSGLTRRRGGAGPADTEDGISRVSSPAPAKRTDEGRSGPETSYESNENGHKIAFDPRDMNESAERSKQPKLTLMEEILLMGLKDKQVIIQTSCDACTGAIETDCIVPCRAISPSGMTTSPTPYEVASSSNWLSAGG